MNWSFLNSVLLSVKILELPPKMQYICVLYASQIVSADLSGIGMAIVYPVSMSMHVRINLFPFEVTGEIGPTKSIQINCIGISGVLKCPNSAELFPWFCSTHSVQFLVFKRIFSHTRPKIQPLEAHVCPSSTVISTSVVC